MALGDLYLGPDIGSLELLSPNGRTFETNNNLFSRDERTASARLVRDIIATKKEFTLSYELIDDADLQTFKDLYDEESELIFRVYTDVSTYDDYTVLMDPIAFTRFLLTGGGLWADVTITLVEV